MIMIAIVFLIIMIITYWSWCSLWKLSLNYWGVQRKVKVKISLILPIIFTRYNVTGFVEELPQLPENRYGHACSALPATGVRPAQPTFVVAGGWTSGLTSSVLTFLPGAEEWTDLASLPRPLRGAQASIVGGRLRVTGGIDEYDGYSFRSEVMAHEILVCCSS